MNSFPVRLLLFICLLLSVFLLPWFFTLALIILYMVLVRGHAFEVLLPALLFDLVYGTARPIFFDVEFFFSAFTLLLYLGVYYGKRTLFAYNT